MADETYVNVSGMNSTARELAVAAQAFEQAVRTLNQKLAPHEGCWSDDEIGKAFAGQYKDAPLWKTNMEKFAGSLSRLGSETVPKVVENFVKVDEVNATNIRNAKP